MKRKIILDIFFYVAVPLIFWNFLRDFFGGYYTLLASTVPGTIYAITTFIREKEHRITGYVLFGGMILARLLDLIVDSPEAILWNDVWINILFAVLWGTSLVLRKPIGMYFFLDYASYSGVDYHKSKEHYIKHPLKQFYILTIILFVQDVVIASTYAILITKLGIGGFNKILTTMGLINYLNIGIIVLYVIHTIKVIKNKKQIETN